MSYDKLFTPIKIGNVELKNRIAMAPMLMGFGVFDGTATESMLDYYEERAKGGTGLIFTEITRINDVTGAGAFAQLAASHDYHIESIGKLAERVHKHGAKLFVQLHHPGRQNVGLLVGTIPLSIKVNKIWKGYSKMLYKLAPSAGKFLISHNIVPSSVAPSKVEPSYFAGGRVRGLKL
jgi:2,4-dienoyl-CoA reductase-like NADH-dependent reductase (Old Yellow Enzyme family)